MPGLESGIVSLLRQASRPWAALASVVHLGDFWKWKHQDGPLGPSLISVAMAGSEVVGCIHSTPARLTLGGQVRFCCYTSDAAVRSDYRRKGLLYGLVDHANQVRTSAGMQFGYFMTLNPVLKKPYTRNYQTLPVDCTCFLKLWDLRPHLRRGLSTNRWIRLFGYALLALKSRLLNGQEGGRDAPGKYRIATITRFDERADDFLHASAAPFTVVGERTSPFVNWRFCDPRGGDFIAKAAVRDGEMLACVAAKIERSDPEYHSGFIVDILALPGESDAAEALVRDVVRQLHRTGVSSVRCMLPKSSPFAGTLRRCGFVDTHQKQTVFVEFLGDCRVDLRDIARDPPGSHHFTYADVDIV